MLIVGGTLIFCASSRAANRALVIGINTYRYHDQLMAKKRMPLNLEGCVDDARDMRQTLIDFLGFSSTEIKMLLNEQAFLADIEREIVRWLVNGTAPGDRVFFYFSGHGFLMKRPQGDQTLLCPHDANPFDLSNLLSANRMAELFAGLKGRTLVAVVDSCHSASALRGLKTVGNIQARARQFPGQQKYRSSGRKRDFQYVQVDRLFLAACGVTEKAWELPIAGRTRGVFTYAMIRVLESGPKEMPMPKQSLRPRIKLCKRWICPSIPSSRAHLYCPDVACGIFLSVHRKISWRQWPIRHPLFRCGSGSRKTDGALFGSANVSACQHRAKKKAFSTCWMSMPTAR